MCVIEDIPTIHAVFDRYLENSLKSQTREKRGKDNSKHTTVHIQGKMTIPDWKSSLVSSSLKAELTKVYTVYLGQHYHKYITMTQHKYVIGGLGEKALKVSSDVVHVMEQLRSNHEEADTRMVLHVAYKARQGAKRIIVSRPDTDLFILLVYHFHQLDMSEVFLKTGTKSIHADLTRFISGHKVVNKLTVEQINNLLCVYGFTGCDTCIAPYGKEKKKTFNIMKNKSEELQGLAHVGTDNQLLLTAWLACMSFVGLLYGSSRCLSLNKLRVNKVLEIKKAKPRKLSPTDDSFILHVLRYS